jgi:hypothetical protein
MFTPVMEATLKARFETRAAEAAIASVERLVSAASPPAATVNFGVRVALTHADLARDALLTPSAQF